MGFYYDKRKNLSSGKKIFLGILKNNANTDFCLNRIFAQIFIIKYFMFVKYGLKIIF